MASASYDENQNDSLPLSQKHELKKKREALLTQNFSTPRQKTLILPPVAAWASGPRTLPPGIHLRIAICLLIQGI
jgi:hypothetical protein